MKPLQPAGSVAAWCPSCGGPIKTEAHRGQWGQGWPHSPLPLAQPSHRHSLLVKILLSGLPIDLPILLGKYKLSAAGLGPGVSPVSAPVIRVIPSTGCWLRHNPVKAAKPRAAARVRSGTNELEGSSSWDPAQGLGCSSRQFPSALGMLCCRPGASPQCRSRDRGELPEHADLRKPIQPLFQQSI